LREPYRGPHDVGGSGKKACSYFQAADVVFGLSQANG
jgi:hypothetical protein